MADLAREAWGKPQIKHYHLMMRGYSFFAVSCAWEHVYISPHTLPPSFNDYFRQRDLNCATRSGIVFG